MLKKIVVVVKTAVGLSHGKVSVRMTLFGSIYFFANFRFFTIILLKFLVRMRPFEYLQIIF